MSEITKPKPGLSGKSYSALFRSDRPERKIEFDVEGKPCFATVRQMGKNSLLEYADLLQSGVTESEAVIYLVGRTLTGCCLWTRQRLAGGTPGEWQQVAPPEGCKDLRDWIRSDFDALGDFWRDLQYECLMENGFTEEQQGNSPAPSAS